MPDSRTRWQAIWDRREELAEIAHSHPNGMAAFSATDETTMTAINSALGRAPRYSVVTPSVTLVRDAEGTRILQTDPWWADLLRLASGMNPSPDEEE